MHYKFNQCSVVRTLSTSCPISDWKQYLDDLVDCAAYSTGTRWGRKTITTPTRGLWLDDYKCGASYQQAGDYIHFPWKTKINLQWCYLSLKRPWQNIFNRPYYLSCLWTDIQQATSCSRNAKSRVCCLWTMHHPCTYTIKLNWEANYFLIDCTNSASCHRVPKDIWKRRPQFVPVGIPTICWKTFPVKPRNIVN